MFSARTELSGSLGAELWEIKRGMFLKPSLLLLALKEIIPPLKKENLSRWKMEPEIGAHSRIKEPKLTSFYRKNMSIFDQAKAEPA